MVYVWSAPLGTFIVNPNLLYASHAYYMYVQKVRGFKLTYIRTYLDHLLQLLHVASDKVEEREAVKILGPLVSHFYHLYNKYGPSIDRVIRQIAMH